MKTGKVPESILKRSILKKIDNKRSEVLGGAGVGADCAFLALKDDEIFVLSTDPVTGARENIGALSIIAATNDIAAAGAEPVAVLVTAILDVNSTEDDIKAIMEELNGTCKSLNVALVGGHTEVTEAVTRPLLSVTAVGKVKKGFEVRGAGAHPGDDVVLTKWIGLEGTAILAKEKEAELLSRFPSRLIYDAQNFDRYLSVIPEAATAVKSGVTAMHDVTEGGIFGGLWEIAESSGVGLTIDLRKIPVKQETIEICNYFDINPYELISGGAMLMIGKDGNKLVLDLKEAGIEAAVIGKCSESNDRVLINGENKRFLEPAKTDEIYKII